MGIGQRLIGNAFRASQVKRMMNAGSRMKRTAGRVGSTTSQIANVIRNRGRQQVPRRENPQIMESEIAREMRRVQRLNERRKRLKAEAMLKRQEGHKIETAKKEIQKIVELLKNSGELPQRCYLDNPRILDQMAMDLVRNLKGDMRFVTEKNPQYKEMIGKMISQSEQTFRTSGFRMGKTMSAIDQAHEVTKNSISEVFANSQ
jgi:hypothetical protein